MKTIILIIFISYILDLVIGDPSWFYHPVIVIGKLISFLDKKIRKISDSKIAGGFIVLITLLVVFIFMFTFTYIFFRIYFIGLIFSIISLCTCFSTKSLSVESLKVKKPLIEGDILKARKYLSYIVGRETDKLNESEIIRATVETIAENTVDGTISPMFFAFLGGIIGYFLCLNNNSTEFGIMGAVISSMIYKAINTMDSMIGYKNKTYINIGMVAAKLDDFANLIPARLSIITFTISSIILKLDYKSCFKISIRDRKNHKSPNCAFPEGAVAGALGIQLGGDNIYFGEIVKKPTIGDNHKKLEILDIDNAIRLMYVSTIVSILILSSFTFLFVNIFI